MNKSISRLARLNSIVKRDSRYRLEAYVFVMEALHHEVEKLKKKTSRIRHLSAGELMEAIRKLAWERYGRLAKPVFEHWGIKTTADFGEIVFNLIEVGEFSKTDDDRREDFEGIFDLDELITLYPLGDARKDNS